MSDRTAAAQTKPSLIQLPELDGIRGYIVLWLMMYHIWVFQGEGSLVHAWGRVAKRGWFGVEVFFTLSGFLITGILLDALGTEKYYRNFYIRRSLRIFPLYYLVITGLVIAGSAALWLGFKINDPSIHVLGGVWWNYTYLTNFALAIYGHNHTPFDVGWSLALEEQFYLLFPVLVSLTTRAQLKKVMIGAIVLAPFARYLSARLLPGGFLAAYSLLCCRMDAVAIGALTAIWLREPGQVNFRRLSRLTIPLVLIAIASVVLLKRQNTLYLVAGYGWIAAAAAAIIASLHLEDDRVLKPFRPFLRKRWLTYIGKISYGLYLFHMFVRVTLDRLPFLADYRHNLPVAVLRTVAFFALSILVAHVSWKLFEKPILAFKDRWAPVQRREASRSVPPEAIPAPAATSPTATAN